MVTGGRRGFTGGNVPPFQAVSILFPRKMGKSQPAEWVPSVAQDWTKRCVRQADHILVAANFNGQGRGDVPQKLDVNHGES